MTTEPEQEQGQDKAWRWQNQVDIRHHPIDHWTSLEAHSSCACMFCEQCPTRALLARGIRHHECAPHSTQLSLIHI
eukprot:9136433-Alexandrium_andersonii.AAC.1